MLEIDRVSYTIGGNQLLSRITFSAASGRLLAIIGPNGAGKSTLLRIIAGELRPTSGTVELDGVGIERMKPHELAGRRAVVPQASNLGFPFTAAEVVALGHSVPGFMRTGAEMTSIVEAVMQQVDILSLAERSYQSLSGGERQRVHFARALCQLRSSHAAEGQFLMLDEPTANLDLAHQLLVLDQARHFAEEGATVITVLHDWNLAARFCDGILLLCDGMVAAAGAPSEIFRDDVLSQVFKCRVRCNSLPEPGVPFVLPQTCS